MSDVAKALSAAAEAEHKFAPGAWASAEEQTAVDEMLFKLANRQGRTLSRKTRRLPEEDRLRLLATMRNAVNEAFWIGARWGSER